MKFLAALIGAILLASVSSANIYVGTPPRITTARNAEWVLDNLSYKCFATTFEAKVKTFEASVYSLYTQNINPSSRYIQHFNSTKEATSGATPEVSFIVAGSSTILIPNTFFGQNGMGFSTGVSWAVSTTVGTLTAGAATDEVILIEYK